MTNLKIKTRLFACFILIATMTVSLGLVGYTAVRHTRASIDKIADIYLPSIASLADARFNFTSIQMYKRALLTKEFIDRKELYEGIAKADKTYKDALAAYSALPKTPDETEVWRRFQPALAESETVTAKVFSELRKFESDRTDAESFDRAVYLADGEAEAKFRVATDMLAELMAINSRNAANARISSDQEGARDMTIMVSFMIAVPLLSLLFGYLLTLSINRPLDKTVAFADAVASGNLEAELNVRQKDEIGRLAESFRVMVATLKDKIAEADHKTKLAAEEAGRAQEATAQAREAQVRAESAEREGRVQAAGRLEGVVGVVTSASEELAAQIEQSSRGADIQSQRVGETATAMEEMNASVLEVARSASTAAETSGQARARAERGAKIVSDVVLGIGEVDSQTRALKADMAALGQQAEGIGRIMGVISDIADQTNLLALNAAIEAARAGEAGRGFAVVADEVRKLAEKTMSATREVGEAIHGIQDGAKRNIESVERSSKAIEDTTALADQAGTALREIVGLVDSAADQVRAIATASEEQSAASEQINRSVEEVNRISVETSDAMRQSARSVAELSDQAQVLRGLIAELKA